MFEVLQSFQDIAFRFESKLLTVVGIALILAGLCLWLAGLRWERITGAVLLALTAVIAAAMFKPTNIIWLIVLGVISGFVGAMTGRLVVCLFAVVLVGFCCISVLTWPEISSFDKYEYPAVEDAQRMIGYKQAVKITSDYASVAAAKFKAGIKTAQPIQMAIAIIAAVAIMAISFFASRFVVAVFCSAVGSAVIFAGMVLLLFYKGSKPVEYINAKVIFFGTVYLAMVLFGSTVQLLLCPCRTKTEDKDNKQE